MGEIYQLGRSDNLDPQAMLQSVQDRYGDQIQHMAIVLRLKDGSNHRWSTNWGWGWLSDAARLMQHWALREMDQ